MAKQIKKSISWFAIGLLICVVATLGYQNTLINAASSGIMIPTVEVGNADPTVTNLDLNGGSNISLTDNTTTSVTCIASSTDTNGHENIISATGTIFRSGVALEAGCASNDNNCYQIAAAQCASSSPDGNSVDWTCDPEGIWFHADPTDASSTDYSAENWNCEITVTDFASSVATGTDGSPPEMSTLYGLLVDGAVNFGALSINGSSTASSTSATNTGNENIELNIYGVDMETSSYTIAVGQIEYASATFTHSDGDANDVVVDPGFDYIVDLTKPTDNTPSNSVELLYWSIEIPGGQEPGIYTGTNTISAVAGE